MEKPKSTRKQPSQKTPAGNSRSVKNVSDTKQVSKPNETAPELSVHNNERSDSVQPVENSSGAETTQKIRARKITPVEIAIEKYTANGWNIIKPPRGAVNDFMASRGTRFHFVQVVTKATIDDAKFHGEAKNNFVQNAFSNGAIPIFAHVVEGPKSKVTFEDVNTGNRVIVEARAKKN